MSKLNWRSVTTSELALLLKQAQLDDSRAVGTSTVYQLRVEGHDLLAVSLSDGQALLIEAAAKPTLNRRHRTSNPRGRHCRNESKSRC